MIRQNDIIVIVNILRRVTKVVKLSPFIFAIAYIISMIGYIFCSDDVAILLDQLFYTSPLVVIMNIILSYSLRMCNWHRFQCLLPMFHLIPLFIDECIYELSEISLYVNCVSIILLCIFSLVNAYFVFIHNPKS